MLTVSRAGLFSCELFRIGLRTRCCGARKVYLFALPDASGNMLSGQLLVRANTSRYSG